LKGNTGSQGIQGIQGPPGETTFLPNTGGGGGGGCFLQGTMIAMADGSEKPIEQIKKGDKLKSWKKDGMLDEKESKWYEWETDKVDDGNIVESTVIRFSPNTYHHYWTIKTSDDVELKATWEHPLLIGKDGVWKWRQIRVLEVGDKLLKYDGSEVSVTSMEETWAPIVTFNIDVEETDTYYANNILAHNTDQTVHREQVTAQLTAQGATEEQVSNFFFGDFGGNELIDEGRDTKLIF